MLDPGQHISFTHFLKIALVTMILKRSQDAFGHNRHEKVNDENCIISLGVPWPNIPCTPFNTKYACVDKQVNKQIHQILCLRQIYR